MFDITEFLELIGWGDWAARFFSEKNLYDLTFCDVTFGTLPYMLQLAFIIFLLNWIMGIIGDACRLRLGGSRF